MRNEGFSLEDERRERTLSPGAMTARRFFRNRLAVVGLGVLLGMFLFSFVGGALTPYGQDQVFYRDEIQWKPVAGVSENTQYRYESPQGELDPVLRAQFGLALDSGQTTLSWQENTYTVTREGEDFYALRDGDAVVGIAHKDLINPTDESQGFSFDFIYNALLAYTADQPGFSDYVLDDMGGVYLNGGEVAYITRFIVQSRNGASLSRQFRETAAEAVRLGQDRFSLDGEYALSYDAGARLWTVREQTATRVWDSYAPPSKIHPLGTDKNGMDMLTRLMYGGRVSLVIGFVVVLIAGLLGVLLGGISGYFGGWADNLIMRAVDVLYCIPSTPLLIILGAAMDGMRVDSQIRMLFLMLILGFLGWPGIARLVRGQILSLREQEFMTATEACGLRVHRRIFRHLIPNVIPQLIVTCTMSLGSTIITEATLSFLGLGVKFPFASWGNIMNDVANAHVLTSYWFVWIPAGVCLMLAVLGFNFVGDGLRDAFDPRMKR